MIFTANCFVTLYSTCILAMFLLEINLQRRQVFHCLGEDQLAGGTEKSWLFWSEWVF